MPGIHAKILKAVWPVALRVNALSSSSNRNDINSNRSMMPFICKIIFREPDVSHGRLFESDTDTDPKDAENRGRFFSLLNSVPIESMHPEPYP